MIGSVWQTVLVRLFGLICCPSFSLVLLHQTVLNNITIIVRIIKRSGLSLWMIYKWRGTFTNPALKRDISIGGHAMEQRRILKSRQWGSPKKEYKKRHYTIYFSFNLTLNLIYEYFNVFTSSSAAKNAISFDMRPVIHFHSEYFCGRKEDEPCAQIRIISTLNEQKNQLHYPFRENDGIIVHNYKSHMFNKRRRTATFLIY